MTINILETLTCLETESLASAIKKMSDKESKYIKGVIAVVNKKGTLVGSFVDGDLRRIINEKKDLEIPISEYMIKDPIFINRDDLESNNGYKIVSELENKLQRNVRNIFLVDEGNLFIGSISKYELYEKEEIDNINNCCILGLGFVGLTVASHISSFGIKVYAQDSNNTLIDELSKNETRFDEPGLKNIIKDSVDKGFLEFVNNPLESDVYIISVGSPISDDGTPDLSQVLSCLDSISKVIAKGALIIIRSTIPLGSSRDIFVPYFEKITNMKCGDDWHLSFAPERTIEGDALKELRDLPQIVSGYSKKCSKISKKFFDRFCKSVVVVDTLESAELAKLACNTFRDLQFSFANELSAMCENYNINTRRLIEQINFDYPRAKIPLPSPGVGGYCLTKDPIIYSNPINKPTEQIELGKVSRKVNENALRSPNRALGNFVEKYNLSLSMLNILIVGIAFKGTPETNDIRFSTSIDFFNSVKDDVNKIYGFDNCISQKDLVDIGFSKDFDVLDIHNYEISAIFYLNNHSRNSDINLSLWLETNNPKLLYDGWGCRNDLEFNDIEKFSYTTLGKINTTHKDS